MAIPLTPSDTVLRCGKRTDLPLSSSGREQAHKLGRALGRLIPEGIDSIYASTLQRTKQTAALVLEETGWPVTVTIDSQFDEIDYGEDDGVPEDDVLARLGKEAIENWNKRGIVPSGWHCDPAAIIAKWKSFLTAQKAKGHATSVVVTSSGIARFVWPALGDDVGRGKLGTGAYGILISEDHDWRIGPWNIRPE